MIETVQRGAELDAVKQRQEGYLINQRLYEKMDIVHPLPLSELCARALLIT